MIFKRKQFVYHQDTKTLRNNIKKTWCLRAFVVKRKGVTLTEMAVVIGIAALMVALTLPAANMLFNSFESESGTKSMLNAALSSARAIAAKEQRYAGIRFQKRYDPNNPDPLNESQYIIFIIKIAGQQTNSLDYGFCAVDGIQPIKLPDSIGAMDLMYANRRSVGNDIAFTEYAIDTDGEINSDRYLLDTTTFSIIFSPSGKLVVHEVRLRNRDEIPDTTLNTTISYDDVFNKIKQIEQGIGLFRQDDYCAWIKNTYPDLGLGPELSRSKFYIYDTKQFKKAYQDRNPWTGYLQRIAQNPVYVSPYTGAIINEK